MRTALLLCVLTIFALPAQQQQQAQTPASDPVATVRNALSEVSEGLYTSWTEKELARLGDASSVSLTKLFAGKSLTRTDVDHALIIISLSFATPKLIQDSADREPRTTMFLLKNFEGLPLDDAMKQRIAKTREMLTRISPSADKR